MGGDFILNLPNVLRGLPTLESYGIYNPKTLQEIAKKYAMQNLTSEQLEEFAETGHPAFDLLPLTAEQKAGIVAKNSDQWTPAQRAGITAEQRLMG